MHIFRSGIKGSSRKKSRVNVGVEETKEDKRKTAKSGEDKEGERECRRVHNLKNRMNKMCKEKKLGKTKKQPASEVQVESCCFPVGCKLLHCTETEKRSAPAGVISVTDKELYAQCGVSRGTRPHRERGTHLHNWPRNCQQLAWSGLRVLKPLCVQIQIS